MPQTPTDSQQPNENARDFLRRTTEVAAGRLDVDVQETEAAFTAHIEKAYALALKRLKIEYAAKNLKRGELEARRLCDSREHFTDSFIVALVARLRQEELTVTVENRQVGVNYPPAGNIPRTAPWIIVSWE